MSNLNPIVQAALLAPICESRQDVRPILDNLLTEVQAVIKDIPNPLSPARMRLQAAVDLANLGHVPRRPLPELLQREADVVGAGLDAQSLEQGEPA